MSASAPLNIIIPGGSGQLGTMIARHLHAKGHRVTVLSRTPRPALWATAFWDGHTLDPAWTQLLEGADAVLHLSGKSVNCRYTPENMREIVDSRVIPTRLIGQAIERALKPPRVWMNASTSTFYRDTYDRPSDRPQDEYSGEPGGQERDTPSSWKFSISVAKQWEEAFYASPTPQTSKIALRTSMTMSPDPGGVFQVLSGWFGPVWVERKVRDLSMFPGSTNRITAGLSICFSLARRSAARSTSPRRSRCTIGTS